MSIPGIDIFDYWSSVPGSAHTHPQDDEVLARTDHSFDLRCLPGPWVGPLRTARVVLLYLAPGLSDPFDLDFASTRFGQEWSELMRQGQGLLPSREEHWPGNKWWRSRVALFERSEETTRNIAIAELAAYHSVNFVDWPMIAALPSSRAMLHWAQNVLFPQAMAGERLVVCMRAARYWGLLPGWSNGYLFAPETNRSGHLLHNGQRREIVALARSMLG